MGKKTTTVAVFKILHEKIPTYLQQGLGEGPINAKGIVPILVSDLEVVKGKNPLDLWLKMDTLGSVFLPMVQ